MPKLFLHIGTHKTGTTSIQRFCVANRDLLRARGVWYPPASTGNFPKHYAHHQIAHAIAGRHDSLTIDDARAFFERVRRKMSRDEACLISAEPMYRHLLIGADERDLPTAQLVAEREARLAAYARAVRDCVDGFDTTVLIMVRRQDLFAESLYAEHVFSTGYPRPIERFVRERDHLLRYESRINDWADAFGSDRISVKVFEKATLSVPIEQTFVEWLGLDWDDDFTIGRRHNITPPRAFVEFKRFLNDPHQPTVVNDLYRRSIERMHTSIPSEEIPDLGRYYLQPRDRVELLEQYEPSNRSVATRYLGRSTLFEDDVASDLVGYVDRRTLTYSEFRDLTKRMLSMIAQEGAEPR